MTQNFRKSEVLDPIAAALLGVVAFMTWAGPRLLDPTDTGWLSAGDRAIHTIGWWYFRSSPWGLPPGINPRNGLEISSSVGLSDSLPLFAFPFKLLAPILPATFQYWGLWLLLSMILQAVFGWALARQMRLSRLTSLIFAAFMLLMPALLQQQQLHMALAGHWVLLAALYLYVKQVPPPRYLWPLLLALTAGIHVYLLAMVLAIWIASLLQRGLLSRGSAIEFVLGAAATLLVLWVAGFMMISSFGANGFGQYRLNLLALFDPYGFSLLLPALPHTVVDYEGLAFPGLGVLLLLGVAIIAAGSLIRRVASERWMPLLLVSIALLAFAVSNRPVVGQFELGTIPLPAGLLHFAALFRASGRMVWPVLYLLVLAVFVMLDRRFGARRTAIFTAIALAVQIVDISGGWQMFEKETAAIPHDWPTPMQSAFWEAAPRHYAKLRAIPAMAVNPEWPNLSHYASLHGMASDATYLGRVDYAAFTRLETKARAALANGSFEPDALYVLDLPSAILARRYAGPDDLLAKVDKYYLFARGGAALAAETGVIAGLPALPRLAVGETVSFSGSGDGARYLPPGDWQPAAAWGTPISPPTANLGFHLPDGNAHSLHLVLASRSFDGGTSTPPLAIEVDGALATTIVIPMDGTATVDLPIPASAIGGDVVIGLHAEIGDPAAIVGPLPDLGVVSMMLGPPP